VLIKPHRDDRAEPPPAVPGVTVAELADRAGAAVELQRRLGDRFGEAETLDSLGYIHRSLGDVATAAGCYQRAAELYRESGDRFNEADTLVSLGEAYRDGGDPARASAAWRAAMAIFEELEHPDAAGVRNRLSS
jgi:tetratricopeptide (TPR) repeat protein